METGNDHLFIPSDCLPDCDYLGCNLLHLQNKLGVTKHLFPRLAFTPSLSLTFKLIKYLHHAASLKFLILLVGFNIRKMRNNCLKLRHVCHKNEYYLKHQ